MGLFVSRTTIIRKSQQDDEIDAARHEFSRACKHLLSIASFIEVADQNQVGLGRMTDQALAIGECCVDV